MVVAMWAVFVGILELVCILSEALLALFASEDHLVALEEFMVFALLVALGAVEPLAAYGHNQPSSCHVFVPSWRSSPLVFQLSLPVSCAFSWRKCGVRWGVVVFMVHVQQAERMATCALRTCLLGAVSMPRASVAIKRLYIPHISLVECSAEERRGSQ